MIVVVDKHVRVGCGGAVARARGDGLHGGASARAGVGSLARRD